jgi:predicted small secreted protein
MLKKVLLVFALIAVVYLLSGCQTVQGIGGDIKWIGQKGSELVD